MALSHLAGCNLDSAPITASTGTKEIDVLYSTARKQDLIGIPPVQYVALFTQRYIFRTAVYRNDS